MKLKKIPTTWRGIQNSDETTNGDFQDFLDGTGWWAGDRYKLDETRSLYHQDDYDKVKPLYRDWWFCVSSKGKVKVMDPWKFAGKFEVDE